MSLVRGSAWHLTVGLYTGSEQPGHPTLNHPRQVNFTYLAYFVVSPFPPAGTPGPPSQRLSSLPSQRVIADCNNHRAEKLWLLVLQKSLFLVERRLRTTGIHRTSPKCLEQARGIFQRPFAVVGTGWKGWPATDGPVSGLLLRSLHLKESS